MPALKNKPKSIDHRAKIAASRIWKKDENPEEWQEEYELRLRLFNLRLKKIPAKL